MGMVFENIEYMNGGVLKISAVRLYPKVKEEAPLSPGDRPIQSPFTTHEGMWRIYSNPDPHG